MDGHRSAGRRRTEPRLQAGSSLRSSPGLYALGRTEPVTRADQLERHVLDRVFAGWVVALGTDFYDGTRRLGSEITTVLDALLATNVLALARPSPSGYRMVCVTVTAQQRYAQLGGQCRPTEKPPPG